MSSASSPIGAGVPAPMQQVRRTSLAVFLALAFVLVSLGPISLDGGRDHARLRQAPRNKVIWRNPVRRLRLAFQQVPGNDSQYAAADHVTLGEALYARGDVDGSIREYRAALRLVPGLATAHYQLGLALGAKGDADGEISEYRAALRSNPKLADAHLYLAETLLRSKNDVDGAIAEYRAALRIYPDQLYSHSLAAHAQLGGALAQKADWDGAIAEFRAAIRVKPDNPAPHLGLGMALEEKKQYEEAFQEYSRALALDPKAKIIRDHYDYLRAFLGKN